MSRAVAVALVAAALALAVGCVRVHAYQRETLAHPALAQPPWPERYAAHAHVYDVREGSAGAVGVGGGGCGCN